MLPPVNCSNIQMLALIVFKKKNTVYDVSTNQVPFEMVTGGRLTKYSSFKKYKRS